MTAAPNPLALRRYSDSDPDVVDLLRANMEEQSIVPSASVSCCAYRCGDDPKQAGLAPPYDVVVGADIINPDLDEPVLLVESILALSHERTVVILSMEARPRADISGFRELMRRSGFVVKDVMCSGGGGGCGCVPSRRPSLPNSAELLDETAPISIWRCMRRRIR